MNDLLIRVLRRLHLSRRLVLYAHRTVCGQPFKIPLFLGMGTQHLEVRDAWIDPVLQVLLTHYNGTFIDAGVNVGRVLLKVRVIAPMTPYLGFEPNPACITYLGELMRANGLDGITVVPAALGSEHAVEELLLHHLDHDDATATVVPGFKQGHPVERRVMAASLCFDQVAPALLHAPLGVVKVDVEGAEADVLQGMRDHLRRDHPALVLKIPPLYRATNDERAARQVRIEGLLKELGYRLFRVHAIRDHIRLEAIRGAIGLHGELEWSNYLALHEDGAGEVLKGFSLLKT